MLRRLIEERKSGTGQITGQHIAAVLELARHGENGKAVQLPGGVDVRREQNELVFCTNSSRPALRTSGKREKPRNLLRQSTSTKSILRIPEMAT